jgi:hypothetical protein
MKCLKFWLVWHDSLVHYCAPDATLKRRAEASHHQNEGTDDDYSTDILNLSHVEALVYVYANPSGGKIEIEVEDPETIRVTPDGAHEITDMLTSA